MDPRSNEHAQRARGSISGLATRAATRRDPANRSRPPSSGYCSAFARRTISFTAPPSSARTSPRIRRPPTRPTPSRPSPRPGSSSSRRRHGRSRRRAPRDGRSNAAATPRSVRERRGRQCARRRSEWRSTNRRARDAPAPRGSATWLSNADGFIRPHSNARAATRGSTRGRAARLLAVQRILVTATER